jgi:hypothetical protein
MRVYGYAVVDKDGAPAPLGRKVYDAKNAAAVGFNHWTRRIWHDGEEFYHLKDKKLSEQTEFRVVGLVLSE